MPGPRPRRRPRQSGRLGPLLLLLLLLALLSLVQPGAASMFGGGEKEPPPAAEEEEGGGVLTSTIEAIKDGVEDLQESVRCPWIEIGFRRLRNLEWSGSPGAVGRSLPLVSHMSTTARVYAIAWRGRPITSPSLGPHTTAHHAPHTHTNDDTRIQVQEARAKVRARVQQRAADVKEAVLDVKEAVLDLHESVSDAVEGAMDDVREYLGIEKVEGTLQAVKRRTQFLRRIVLKGLVGAAMLTYGIHFSHLVVFAHTVRVTGLPVVARAWDELVEMYFNARTTIKKVGLVLVSGRSGGERKKRPTRVSCC